MSAGQSGISIRRLGADRAGEIRIRRLLENRKVEPQEMVATAREHTLGLVRDRHVLVIQDTTSLRDDGGKETVQLHPAIAVDAGDRALLGLVYATFLRRGQPLAAHCNKRALEDKESRRWIDATREAAALLKAGAARVTMVADREADIYDAFALCPDGVDVLVRVHHDRCLAGGERIYTCLDDALELGRNNIVLPATAKRAARTATLAIRARPVRVKRPKRNRAAEAAKLPPHADLWLVEAREIDPPAGAEAVHWRLLTTHAAGTLAEAKQIVEFYRERWHIEQVFRVMKTQGFDIEAVKMAAVASFENLATATLIAAIQVQQMRHDRDGEANRPATDVFDADDQPFLERVCARLEGKTARQKNPHNKGSLAYATWVCARLGGWTGYYGKPGPIVLLRGHLKFKNMLEGWRIPRDV